MEGRSGPGLGFGGCDIRSRARDVATKFCLGGRIHRHPNPPTLKIWSLLGFRLLYFYNGGKCKFFTGVEKKIGTKIS